MLDELIVVTKAFIVEDAIVIDDDGVVEASTQREVLGAQELEITHETEGTRAGHFLDEGGGREVDRGGLLLLLEHRVIEVDGEGHLEAVVRQEGRDLVTITHFDLALDADELLER